MSVSQDGLKHGREVSARGVNDPEDLGSRGPFRVCLGKLRRARLKLAPQLVDGALNLSLRRHRARHRLPFARLVRGSTTRNSVNAPGSVSTSIEPPCCLTMMSWLID